MNGGSAAESLWVTGIIRTRLKKCPDNSREVTKKRKKRRPSKLFTLSKKLEALRHAISTAVSDKANSSFANQIIATELQIQIEKTHRLSGFNRMSRQEILSGVTPGLGKRA